MTGLPSYRQPSERRAGSFGGAFSDWHAGSYPHFEISDVKSRGSGRKSEVTLRRERRPEVQFLEEGLKPIFSGEVRCQLSRF